MKRRYATAVRSIRFNPNTRKVTLLTWISPKSTAMERATNKAIRRLLLNLTADLNDCTCAGGDMCPACQLGYALRVRP